jgi:hypothetical protein
VSDFTYQMAGISLVPAVLAFAAMYFSSHGARGFPVSAERRALRLVTIYLACLAANLVLTAFVFATRLHWIPSLLLSGLVGYFAGMRVIRPNKPRMSA